MSIREAVSAVFVHDGHLFVIKRQAYLKAFPGYHAFPGGKIDADDKDQPFEEEILAKVDQPKALHALARELQEELGFDLQAAVAQGQVSHVSHLATALAPVINPVRFRNQFFRIDVTSRPDFVVDTQEAEAWDWLTVAELLERYERGRLLVVPPVLRMLQVMSQDMQVEHIPDIGFDFDAEKEVPCWEVLRAFYQLPARSHTLPPADRTNAFFVGDTLIDPSPKDEAELARLEYVLERLKPHKIMLTHHHPDHYQFADVLARKYNWPIWLSEDTHQRISAKKKGFFEGIATQHLKDGDVLTQWQDEDVLVHAVPGHDEGQLAPAPRSLAWMIVGDLIQGIGTVVIHAPEGHMGRYFQSLEKVIRLDPKIIIPSHGAAMGSTYRIKATLEHRRQREAQVLALKKEGKGLTEILGTVYKGLDPRLAPFAMANIQSHLTKLQEEGLVEASSLQ